MSDIGTLMRQPICPLYTNITILYNIILINILLSWSNLRTISHYINIPVSFKNAIMRIPFHLRVVKIFHLRIKDSLFTMNRKMTISFT